MEVTTVSSLPLEWATGTNHDYGNSDPFQETLWCYVIVAIVVILIGIILLIPNCTISNILVTVSWVVAMLGVMIASLYTLINTTGAWYYFTLVVTILLVIFTIIWAGEYHNRGAHSSKLSNHQDQLWYTGITVMVIIGMMILLGCALQTANDKSYSIPAASVAVIVWLILSFC